MERMPEAATAELHMSHTTWLSSLHESTDGIRMLASRSNNGNDMSDNHQQKHNFFKQLCKCVAALAWHLAVDSHVLRHKTILELCLGVLRQCSQGPMSNSPGVPSL